MASESVVGTITIYVGFQKIKWDESYFRPSTLKKGKNLQNSQHVFLVKERLGEEISGKCMRETNVNQEPYCVKIKV